MEKQKIKRFDNSKSKKSVNLENLDQVGFTDYLTKRLHNVDIEKL